MAILDLVSRRMRLLVGGVDFGGSIAGILRIDPLLVEETGLRTVEATVTLQESLSTPESLDPELNPRWVVGQVVKLEVANIAGVLTAHPGFGFRLLRVPFYDEIARTLRLDLGCELTYRRNRDEAGADCTGIDPRTGRPLDQVINALLLVAGVATGLEAGANNPTQVINYPQQKKAGESFIDQAGEMAATANQPGYLWADGDLRVRFELSANPVAPTLTLTPEMVLGYERIDSQEFAEPFEELKLVATQTTVIPITYPRKLDPQETYKTLKEIFPDKAVYFATNNPLVLVEGIYPVEDWDGVSIKTIDSKSDFLSRGVFSTIIGVGGTGYSLERSKGQVLEKFYYHPKPANWNSCRPEDNPKSNAGLIRQYVKTWPLTGYKHTIDYTYDDRQNLIRKLEIKINPLLNSTAPKILVGPNTVPTDAGYWEEDTKWIESSYGSGQWTKITKVKAPGGNLGNNFDTNNGVPNLAIIDAPPVTDSDSPPEQAPTAPTGFDTIDQQIEVTVRSPARGGGIATKTKTMSLKSAQSKNQLQNFAELITAISWGRAYGRRIELPVYDALLASNYKPLQRWDYNDGSRVIALRVAEPSLVISPDRAMVGVEAGKIGDVNVDGTVTTPFNLIYAAGGVFEIVGGVSLSFPPQPPAVVGDGGVFEIVGGEPPLRWSILTQQQWYNLSQKQYAGMLQ